MVSPNGAGPERTSPRAAASSDAANPAPRASAPSSGRGAFLVAAGILASRLMGLVRERVFAHYFGNSVPAAAFKAALRIPNLLQSLFGEGVLSASFIPVYAASLAKGDREEADRLASAIFGLLSAVIAVLVVAGIFATPALIDLIAPGFEGEARELTIVLVRILFPGTGILVLSAWCLGILNSHRRFFLSYAAPVIWNSAIIVALVVWGGRTELPLLAEYVAYGTVVGCVLQFLVQLPSVLTLLGRFRPSLDLARASVRAVLRAFVPVVIGRGVVQVSAYVDTAYASLISTRALSAMTYAQILYLLPVSLFGMSVSAAELPEMSSVQGSASEVAATLRARLVPALRRISFFVVPSVFGLLVLGDVITAALFQTGRFGAGDSRYVWYILIASAVGLVATTTARLYSSTFYALKDTKTPLYIATARVAVGAALGYFAALELPARLGVPSDLGAAGILFASSISAWTERELLRRTLEKRIGAASVPVKLMFSIYAGAAVAAAAAFGTKLGLARYFGEMPGLAGEWGGAFFAPPNLDPVITAGIVLAVFGGVYFGATGIFGVPEARAVFKRLLRRR